MGAAMAWVILPTACNCESQKSEREAGVLYCSLLYSVLFSPSFPRVYLEKRGQRDT